MRKIDDGSVDMILVDPPYGTTQNKWDSVIPLDRMWAEYRRVLKRNGACVIFCAQPFTSVLITSNLSWFKYEWCWQKPKGTGHLNAKKQPMRDKEDIAVFYERQCTYNPQMTAGDPYKPKAGKNFSNNSSMTESYGSYTDFRNHNNGTRYLRQVLRFGRVERNVVHPTQKPVPLLEYLIRTYTTEGETVLDNCMGSGSTGVACVKTGRNFIGIELDGCYFDTATSRVNQAISDTPEPTCNR
jgi:site-specific DNA-methyltransferase (adenine-specific)